MRRLAIVSCCCCMLAITACAYSSGPAPVPDWYGDTTFSELERLEVERGAAWLYERAGLLPPRIEWTYEAGPDVMPKTIRRERGPYGEKSASGLCTADRQTVYLDPVGLPEEGMQLRFLAGLTAHELAHCVLGFVDGYREGEAKSEGIMRDLEPMTWSTNEQAQCQVSPQCHP